MDLVILWYPTNGGIAKYDGTAWEVYDKSTLGLSYNPTFSDILIDKLDNKWFAE